ncbi:FAD-binding oxidoreductase [Emcibacter sp.]|uniref:NAD(P)/FAD-dependent oxidoreductase n=1 Tax=Emcibacter sp. TaxID=1979954 RepID=UPI002AA94CB7|nr:FAD-binding oxidoreductase [Emcibacter sp.]
MDFQADFIIIGGGIAGAGAGYELSRLGKVILLEAESQPGYHTTGRSAAVYSSTYGQGDPVLRALVLGSTDFLKNPPEGFSEHALLHPREHLFICDRDDLRPLNKLHDDLARVTDDVAWLGREEILERVPLMTEPFLEKALLERDVADMDVHALHEGFLRGMRSRGGIVMTDSPAEAIEQITGGWRVSTPTGTYEVPILVNAAGAWVDQVAKLAGVAPIGIQPLRRTAILVDPPEGVNIDNWPFVTEAQDKFYFKPDAGKILVSPMDQTPSEPCDAQPEEMDVAYAAHYLEEAIGMPVRKIDHQWAGLRSHVADHHPVAGFAPDTEGFFWLAGQGGFGIKTAVALGRITASLVQGKGLPEDLLAFGLKQSDISAERLQK